MDIFYLYIDKYFNVKDKHLFEHNAGRFIVEYAAKHFYNIKNSEIEIINGKPKFKYCNNVYFSISHSNNIAAVCFDDNPIGFDIEFIKPRNFVSIAKRMNFKLKENTPEEFYKSWTKYESIFKLQQPPSCVITSVFLDKYIIAISSSVRESINFNVFMLG